VTNDFFVRGFVNNLLTDAPQLPDLFTNKNAGD
jgi:hypothetical protein